jgi:type I restriction enzyme S subunit
MKKLGDVCEFVRGPFGSSLKKSNFVNSGFAVYEQQHAINDQFVEVRYFISLEKFKSMKRFEIMPNDLIMSCSGTMGKIAVVPNNILKGIINQALLKITPNNVDSYFLKRYMQSVIFQSEIFNLSKGVAIKNIASVKILKQIKIPHPPLKTQQAIVAKLDETFAELEKLQQHTEQNLINANELFNSYLNKIFTTKGDDWVEKKLGDVCEFENGDRGKNYPSRSKFIDQGIAFINAGHLDCGVVNFKKMNYITEDNYNLLSRGKVRKKDVLFCLRGSLGKYAVIKNSYKAAIASSLVIIRPLKECTVEYLALYLQSSLCNKLIQKYAGGAAQPNLGAKDVAKFYIPLPPLKTQQKIVSKLDKLANEVNQLKTIYNQKLKELAELKQSILEQAFNGKLNI